MRIGLLPSAGTATRMNGIPKFLLPVSEDVQCLLDYHVRLMAPVVDRIIIPTRSEWVGLLHSFSFGPQVDILELNTQTMAETLRRSLEGIDYETCVLGMPDTYFLGGNPYHDLSLHPGHDLTVSLFRTRPEQRGKVGSIDIDAEGRVIAHADKDPDHIYDHHWGVMEFASHTEHFLSPTEPTGGVLITECLARGLDVRGVVADYPYFDCGTLREYVECVSAVNP